MLKIRTTVNANGSVHIDYEGFQGDACLAEAKRLYELLKAAGINLEETSFQPKPELETAIVLQSKQTVEGE
jgi:hypothetical protein